MYIYKADIEYCNYLSYYEPKIPYVKNEKENRPFIGVVLCVNGKNFFAPLTSPKRKHTQMKDMQDFLKIDNGKLGCINLNNMIPIPRRYLTKINIQDIRNIKYRNMLANQLYWINKNMFRINNRARNLYYLVSQNKVDKSLKDRCCNFKLLEYRCQEFMDKNYINEDEILYCFA